MNVIIDDNDNNAGGGGRGGTSSLDRGGDAMRGRRRAVRTASRPLRLFAVADDAAADDGHIEDGGNLNRFNESIHCRACA